MVHPEVASALADRRPVVALESTIISHGLPPRRWRRWNGYVNPTGGSSSGPPLPHCGPRRARSSYSAGEVLTARTDPSLAAADLAAKVGTCVVTCGSDGAYLADAGGVTHVPAPALAGARPPL